MKFHSLTALSATVVAMALVAGVVVVADSEAHGKGFDRRITQQEREEIFRRMELEEDLPCVPPVDPPSNSKTLPAMPDSFTTNVEIAFQDEKAHLVIYGAETFDGVFNSGVLMYQLGEGVIASKPYAMDEIIHYDVPHDEALFIVTDTACEDTSDGSCDPKKTCEAHDLKTLSAIMEELFALGAQNGDGGYFGTVGVLNWGPTLEYVYLEKADCRGMVCDKFQACITDADQQSTVRITYFWSDSKWHVANNGMSVPVAVEVHSNGKVGNLFTQAVRQRFDFYEFLRDFRPSVEELAPPADAYCKHRKSSYYPPVVPYYFSYDSEAVVGVDINWPLADNESLTFQFTIVISQQEHYDWEAKVVVADYIPWYIFGDTYRYDHETRRIQDFNQGLEYYIEKRLNNRCIYGPIENTTSAGDVVVNDDGSVSLLPPWIFENLDEPMQYNGEHSARELPADVWIGLKRVKPTIFEEDYVWYYASPFILGERDRKTSQGNVKAFRNALKLEETVALSQEELWRRVMAEGMTGDILSLDKVPLKMERYLNIMAGYPHLIYNMFNYQYEPPMTHTFDIFPCYNASQFRDFIVDLPGDTLASVNQLRDLLIYSSQQAMAEVGVVSPLRINRMVLEERDDVIRLLFTVLDKATVNGDAPGTLEESDMNTAVNLISSAITNSKLVIIVRIADSPKRKVEDQVAVLPISGSMMEVHRGKRNDYYYSTNKGYHSGDMAGLAIGMLLVGALFSVLVTMLIQRRNSPPGGLPRVSMAHKSRPSPDNTININADLTSSGI